MVRLTMVMGLAALLLAGTTGCGQQAAEATSGRSAAASIDKAKYIATEEPDGAVGVIAAREDAKDQDPIVLVGRIGGRKNPWIEGRAAFTMIDASMTVVADGAESDDGEVCMDDCCASLRTDCTTLVKIVDEQGKPLAIDARELLDVQENDMVVVQGRVQRDDQGAFSIVATGVYVRR